MAGVFISYSHRDEDLRQEIDAALSPLRRQGLIEVWHDRKITPGLDLDLAIDSNLQEADIILFLVSSYFVDSDYAYGIEVQRAMERHEQGDARVIPVILRPTDWQGLPFGKLLALPKDGKAVTSFPDMHEALAQVSKGLRRVIEELEPGHGTKTGPAPVGPADRVAAAVADVEPAEPDPRSSNLRAKRHFTDQELDQFLDDTFEYVATFFENSLNEFKARNAGYDIRFRRFDAGRFSATIYQAGKTAAQCTIWRGGLDSSTDGIAYVEGETQAGNSMNEILNVADDGYMLYLNASMARFHRGSAEEKLTPQGTSEYLWGLLVDRLQ